MKDTHGTNQCKVFVVAVPTETGGVPVRLRTYDTTTDRAIPALIWQAARATSAALTYFMPITIEDIQYCDGGVGWSNPIEEAIAEAHSIWPNRPIGCLLSIGTGLEDAIQLDVKYKNGLTQMLLRTGLPKILFRKSVAEYCVEALTSCERVHRAVVGDLKGRGIDGRYFRFNVNQGMSNIGLDEWERIGSMIAFTKSYMTHGDREEARRKITEFLLDPNRAS
jgi:hypothetical protein